MICPACRNNEFHVDRPDLTNNNIVTGKIERCNKCNEAIELVIYLGKVIGLHKYLIRKSRKRLFVPSYPINCLACERLILLPRIDCNEHILYEEIEKDCPWCRTDYLFRIDYDGKKNWSININIEPLGSKDLESLIEVDSMAKIGVAGTTNLIIRKGMDDRLIGRMGIAIMGTVNFPEMVGCNPWDSDFHDNYVAGEGATVEEVILNIKKEVSSIVDGLFG